MTLSIKVTESKEAPALPLPSYRHYIAGNVYGPDTDPPANAPLQARAIAEGWAVAWPPEEPKAEPAPEVTEAPVADQMPAVDPDVLLADLSPLPEGVRVIEDESLEAPSARKLSAPTVDPVLAAVSSQYVGPEWIPDLALPQKPPAEPIAVEALPEVALEPQEAAAVDQPADTQTAPVGAPGAPAGKPVDAQPEPQVESSSSKRKTRK